MEQALSSHELLIVFERLIVSILCGAIIGLEREWAKKQAGLRTMILICFGATLYITVSYLVSTSTEQPFDVTRIAAQVVTGVGFIGAGAIIQARGHIQGLTTAAIIWTVAAIGLIIGAGFPLLGIGVTVIVLIILVLVRKIERIFIKPLIEENHEHNKPVLPLNPGDDDIE